MFSEACTGLERVLADLCCRGQDYTRVAPEPAHALCAPARNAWHVHGMREVSGASGIRDGVGTARQDTSGMSDCGGTDRQDTSGVSGGGGTGRQDTSGMGDKSEDVYRELVQQMQAQKTTSVGREPRHALESNPTEPLE